MNSSRQPATTRLPLKELVAHFDGFLRTLAAHSQSTRGTYERSLRAFIAWYAIDGRFLFRPRDVERYRKYLVEKRNYRPLSVRTYLNSLRRFLHYLSENLIIADNPAAGVVASAVRPGPGHSALTGPEVDRLLGAVDTTTDHGRRDCAIIQLMLGCALSERELCAANLRDIDLSADVAVLMVAGRGTGPRRRRVPVPNEARLALLDYLRARPGARMPASGAAAPLFLSAGPRASGERMTERGMRAAVHKWLRRSGLRSSESRRISPFSLRHTAGLRLAQQGLGVEELMERMRIESRSSALLYYRIPT